VSDASAANGGVSDGGSATAPFAAVGCSAADDRESGPVDEAGVFAGGSGEDESASAADGECDVSSVHCGIIGKKDVSAGAPAAVLACSLRGLQRGAAGVTWFNEGGARVGNKIVAKVWS